ncbi:heparan-alpha-glucosaminide N-acetyltransferase domain-containing protein [Aliarcobacter butzleri]|uniref:DUF1624 domain-containing protein n=1 Tax=Aliarcobacter butzleri TaxID=28197 RepID=UPI0021B38A03|nr:heparan-alpha-glucosaminide N-acetyltransferase domain-containing protein [Aliarcobacter butzleri]MCT7551692.1 heparan-alpha-glucosaminide N-acetyltransferase domain-containing protein [Aliarcobacter butzleri]
MNTTSTTQQLNQRLFSIDILRGFVMVIMILDHVRETFFLHYQMIVPIDIASTDTILIICRFLAHICAPTFIFLTGLSAYLYMQKVQSKKETSWFLFTRGLFLIVLELTFVNFAWTFEFPMEKLYLQVIWAIGFSMIFLSVLIYLPKRILFILAIVIIFGHNLLDSIHFEKDSIFYILWAVLHERTWIEFSQDFKVRTSYPILPWIGVISLGFIAGEWFNKNVNFQTRKNYLIKTTLILLSSFIVIRFINVYGDTPYISYDSISNTILSFINVSKYPPSLLFILLTLGICTFLLMLFEKYQNLKSISWLKNFGAAPMFFYLIHLYFLKFLYLTAVAIYGLNQGQYFGLSQTWQMPLLSIIFAFILYFPTKWYANLKQKRRDIKWLKYL